MGLVVGLFINNSKLPNNCAELGQIYLEVGKKRLGIVDFGSEKWSKLIDSETKFVNDCYSNISK